MLRARQQRRRNRRQADPAVPATPATAVPTGPAGGDLGGTYPNPTVQSIDNVPGPLNKSITGSCGDGTVTPAKISPTYSLVWKGSAQPPDTGNTLVWMDTVNQVLKIWNGEMWLTLATV